MLPFGIRGLAICNLATYPSTVQSYAVKAFGPFFTWVYHTEDAAVPSPINFENVDTPVTMHCRICTSQPSYNGSPPTC